VTRKHQRLTLALIAVATSLSAIAWTASVPTPTGPIDASIQNVHLLGSDPLPLRVATFNIAGGVGHDGQRNLARTGSALAGFDLVALEEVHGSGLETNQAKTLSEIIKAGWVFAPTESQWWGHKWFGNGLLTNLPLAHCQRVPISTKQSRSNRNMILAEATYLGRPLAIIVTHLDRHEDHDTELHTVIARFESLDAPALLLGDLNTTIEDAQLQSLRQTPGVVDALHEALGDGGIAKDSVDWIFARGLKPTAAGFKDNGASDHHLAWAEFVIVPPATRP
jgi:endonuclease/exonuclease/phosphatase family metal-dependent hydrolase